MIFFSSLLRLAEGQNKFKNKNLKSCLSFTHAAEPSTSQRIQSTGTLLGHALPARSGRRPAPPDPATGPGERAQAATGPTERTQAVPPPGTRSRSRPPAAQREEWLRPGWTPAPRPQRRGPRGLTLKQAVPQWAPFSRDSWQEGGRPGHSFTPPTAGKGTGLRQRRREQPFSSPAAESKGAPPTQPGAPGASRSPRRFSGLRRSLLRSGCRPGEHLGALRGRGHHRPQLRAALRAEQGLFPLRVPGAV